MSQIHFVGGEKGGVGKSVMARLLSQWFIDRGQPFAAIDADRSHGVLLRFYSDYAQHVDLGTPESADHIMDRALGAERAVLVDLPGQCFHELKAWLDGADVIDFAQEMGVELVFWHVTDGSFASVSEVEQAVATLGSTVRHVAVKNLGRARDFSQFDVSDARRLLDEVGGEVIELPELDGGVMYRIDAQGASFWAAANASGSDFAFRPMEQQRVRLWLKRAYASLEQLSVLSGNVSADTADATEGI